MPGCLEPGGQARSTRSRCASHGCNFCLVALAAMAGGGGVFAIEQAGRSSAIVAAGTIALAAIGLAAVSAIAVRRHRLAADRHDTFQLALQEQDELLAAHDREFIEQAARCDAVQQRLSIEIAEKDDFIRTAAHDLGAPLRNISGMAAAIFLKHADELSPDATRRLHRIRANADAQRSLVNDLLELTKLKATPRREEVVDLDALVTELGDLFESDLAPRGIAFKIDGQLPVIRGDRTRLRQLFQNLVDNAIKYMGDGAERVIRIGATVSLGGVTCTVTDTGTGVQPADRARLFLPFGRGRSHINVTQPGTGLGLAGVKSIVQSHGGTIRYDAPSTGGSVFTFTLAGPVIGPATNCILPALSESHS